MARASSAASGNRQGRAACRPSGVSLALRPAQQAGEQAAWIAHPALLPLLPDMRHGLHHRARTVPLDRLVEVAGGKTKPVCLLAGLDLTLGRLVQAETVLGGLFLLVRPCSIESVRLVNVV